MATVTSTTALTLADWAKRVEPDGGIPKIAEILTQSNQILEDMLFVEGNLPTGHRIVIRTGLPTVYWRSINSGVPTSKSTTAQVDESVGMLEAYSEIDKDLALLNGNTGAFRTSEDTAFLESMNQTMVNTLFYGNPASDPRQFLGLATRYSTATAGNGQNILKANTSITANSGASIWLVGWGEQTCFGVFPKGSKAGLQHNDLGEQTIYDANNNRYQALRTHYQWKNGFVVKDWRYVVRVCNIDMSQLINSTTGGIQTAANGVADLLGLMARALIRIPSFGMCQPVFYMNRTLFSILMLQALNKSNAALSVQDAAQQFGKPQQWLSFMGIPVKRVDQLLNTEAQVN